MEKTEGVGVVDFIGNKCCGGGIWVVGDLSMVENITNGVDGDLLERKKTLGEERFGGDNSGLDNNRKLVGFGAN